MRFAVVLRPPPQPAEHDGAGGERHEVRVARPRGVRVGDVEQVVDAVERELDRREGEHRGAPGAAPQRNQQGHSDRPLERSGVANVVPVVAAEGPDEFEEHMRRRRHQQRERQVVRGERGEADAEDSSGSVAAGEGWGGGGVDDHLGVTIG